MFMLKVFSGSDLKLGYKSVVDVHLMVTFLLLLFIYKCIKRVMRNFANR